MKSWREWDEERKKIIWSHGVVWKKIENMVLLSEEEDYLDGVVCGWEREKEIIRERSRWRGLNICEWKRERRRWRCLNERKGLS